MNIPVFKFALRQDLNNNPLFLPKRNSDLDAGWDVACAEPNGVELYPFEKKLIRLGFRTLIPQGWWLELRPRSSTFAKKDLSCLYGVLDEGWEGESCLAVQYVPRHRNQYAELKIEFGERIGQLIPVERKAMEVVCVSNEELDAEFKLRGGKRGAGGFGSTG